MESVSMAPVTAIPAILDRSVTARTFAMVFTVKMVGTAQKVQIVTVCPGFLAKPVKTTTIALMSPAAAKELATAPMEPASAMRVTQERIAKSTITVME